MQMQRKLGPEDRTVLITEMTAEELALLSLLARLRPDEPGPRETIARWSATPDGPWWATFRELDRMTRLFEYLGIILGQWPDSLRPALLLRDSLHSAMMNLGGVVDARSVTP